MRALFVQLLSRATALESVWMTSSVASGHIGRDVLKSQIYPCARVQPCIKEKGKCKAYDRRYHRDLLYDCNANAHENQNNVNHLVYWRKTTAAVSSPMVEREFLSPLFPSCPSNEDSAKSSSASDSKQSLHASTCSCPETSHQLDSGGISLALSLCDCICWHQLRHWTGTRRI